MFLLLVERRRYLARNLRANSGRATRSLFLYSFLSSFSPYPTVADGICQRSRKRAPARVAPRCSVTRNLPRKSCDRSRQPVRPPSSSSRGLPWDSRLLEIDRDTNLFHIHSRSKEGRYRRRWQVKGGSHRKPRLPIVYTQRTNGGSVPPARETTFYASNFR